MRRWLGTALAVVLPLTAAGCSDDQGAGTREFAVSAPTALGAVSLQFIGKGLTGAREAPGSWVAQSLSENPDGTTTLRVVVVAERAGTLTVSVEVADLDDPAPEVTVLEAADGASLPLASLRSVTAALSR